MSENDRMISDSQLDQALNALPREVEPTRDLWAGIHAEISATPIVARKRTMWQWQLAAGIALMIATSATTYFVTKYGHAPTNTLSASGDSDTVVAQYLLARADLDKQFAERLAALPPATRAKLESNLADLRRAEKELVANLSRNPSDPLLHDLLISTYQSEAQLLADVSQLAQTRS